MPQSKAYELLKKHQIHADEVKDGKTSLRHLRHIVRSENLPFDVFHALVRLRR